MFQEQIDELVENKILEALCGTQISESTKVSEHCVLSNLESCAPVFFKCSWSVAYTAVPLLVHRAMSPVVRKALSDSPA